VERDGIEEEEEKRAINKWRSEDVRKHTANKVRVLYEAVDYVMQETVKNLEGRGVDGGGLT